MHFESFTDFVYMSGHGVFVWSAYAVTFISLLLLIIHPLRKKQKLLCAIKQRQLFLQEDS